MSDKKATRQMQYSQLCAELGHLYMNLKKIQARMIEVEAAIERLNLEAAANSGAPQVEETPK